MSEQMHEAGTIDSEEMMWGTLPDGRLIFVNMLTNYDAAPAGLRERPEYWLEQLEAGAFDDLENPPTVYTLRNGKREWRDGVVLAETELYKHVQDLYILELDHTDPLPFTYENETVYLQQIALTDHVCPQDDPDGYELDPVEQTEEDRAVRVVAARLRVVLCVTPTPENFIHAQRYLVCQEHDPLFTMISGAIRKRAQWRV